MARAIAGLCAGILVLLALSPASGGPALSERYRVAGRALAIEAPRSYCIIDPGIPDEAELFGFIEDVNAGLNRVLVVFVDCAELERWRRGEIAVLERYGNILTPIEETLYPGMARGVFLGELQKVMDGGALPLGAEAGQALLEAAAPALEVGESESLGILAVDEAALHAGVAQKLALDGQAVVILGIFSMTLINDVPLSVNLYQPLEDEATIERLVAEQRRFIRQLIERNRHLQGGTPDPSTAGSG
jgi:hypothetical protein